MKQVYLRTRGRSPRELRSDTLFGLLSWGVREVYGRDTLERLLAPLDGDDPSPALRVSSAFPFEDAGDGHVHWFPRPVSGDVGDRSSPWVEDRELLAFVSGREPPACGAPGPRAPAGRFFLAEGPAEAHLEAALGFLSRFGLGGGGSSGVGAFDFEIREAEFLRLARAGDQGLLLSLYHPTPAEAAAIVGAAQGDPQVAWRLERRSGVTGGRLLDAAARWQAPVAMLAEGSVLPVARDPAGSSPVVGRADDGGGEFSVRRHGFGFFVPVSGGGSLPGPGGGP